MYLLRISGALPPLSDRGQRPFISSKQLARSLRRASVGLGARSFGWTSCMTGHDNRKRRDSRPGTRNGSGTRQRTTSSGNARQNYEKYLVRAREAGAAGDRVEMENCYQHAEHYWRVMQAGNAGS